MHDDLLHHEFHKSSGEVFLFLHGFLGSSEQWNSLITKFSTPISYLTIDLPGHGNSEIEDGYSLTELGKKIKSIIDYYEIEKVHLIGHSMGGYLGCAFAKAYPENVLTLTLVNSISSADTPQRLEQRKRSLKLIERYKEAYINMAITNLFTATERKEHKDAIKQMKLEAKDMHAQAVTAAIHAMMNRPSYHPELLELDLPITHIASTNDEIVSQKLVEADSQPLNSAFHLLESGHMSILTHPQELARIIEAITS